MNADVWPLDFNRSLIGSRSEPSVVSVSAEQLKFFANATDQRDPIYSDEAAAQTAGCRGLPVAPTFGFSLVLAAPEQAGFGLAQIRAHPGYVLHAEQEFVHHAMLFAGDAVTITTEIVDMYEKKGGALRFLVQRSELRDATGALCIESIATFAIRGQEALA